jgi:hypothetical protein
MVDQLYWFYCEASSLDFSQNEWYTTNSKNTNVERILENCAFSWASRLTVFHYTWWVVILFVNRLRNYLVAGRWIPLKGKGIWFRLKVMLTMAWNPFEFHIIDILPKRKIFNAMHYVKHILELILALRPKLGGIISSFMQTMLGFMVPGSLKHFTI